MEQSGQSAVGRDGVTESRSGLTRRTRCALGLSRERIEPGAVARVLARLSGSEGGEGTRTPDCVRDQLGYSAPL
jgi:hypothetical protein